jgi:purine-nucleoside/S-methyl-5'-thioadenosine phosphorylase / adenosine deaminase
MRGLGTASLRLPQPNGLFEWVQEAWGPALRCVPLAKACRHLFTTRALELESVGDEKAEGWSKLAAAMGVKPAGLVRLRQVHGIGVTNVQTFEAWQSYDRWPEADIATTRDPSVAVSVRAADCVPVLLADSDGGGVAAVHAGWRGTAAGAVIEAVSALAQTIGAKPKNVVAAIGPSIGPCCYTVGEDLIAKFARHPEASTWFVRREGLRLDLWRATRDQLLRAGIAPDRIHACELCTFDHPALFPSYRRDRDAAGRLVAAVRPNP